MDTIYIRNSLQKKEQPLGRIRLIKIDSENQGITLEGAVFTLYRLNEERGRYQELATDLVTKADGSLLIEHLKPGSYKLVENKAPDRYVPDTAETLFNIELDSAGAVLEFDDILIPNYKLLFQCKPKCCCTCCQSSDCCWKEYNSYKYDGCCWKEYKSYKYDSCCGGCCNCSNKYKKGR